MTWAIAAVVLLLVGLPLAAVWWSRRGFWSRLRSGREADPYGDTMREHRLGPAAMARVEKAVLWGKRLDDHAERAAVVDLARGSLPRPSPRSRRREVLALLLWVAAAAAFVVFVVRFRGWDFSFVWSLAWLVPTWWAIAGPRRAIRLNSDPVPSDRT